MTQEKLNEILEQHVLWLCDNGGSRANLSHVDFAQVNLGVANLSYAILNGADLSYVDLSQVNLSGAILNGVNLSYTDLTRVKLNHANLENANLSGANLKHIDLRRTILRSVDFSGANLSCAVLDYADLSYANFSNAILDLASFNCARLKYANFSGAYLNGTNLQYVDLSGANGLLSSTDFMEAHFERTNDGYIVYKCFGSMYAIPGNWKLEPNAVISETVNPNRTDECGCGINVAPLEWVKRNSSKQIWKLLIKWEWLPDVVVPYNTDGKIRCGKAMILGKVDNEGNLIED